MMKLTILNVDLMGQEMYLSSDAASYTDSTWRKTFWRNHVVL